MDRIKEISSVLSVTDNEELIESFLKSILTEKEIIDISSRWELVKNLHLGKSQRTISKELGLSLCKITRGSKELQRKPSPFKMMIEKYIEIFAERRKK